MRLKNVMDQGSYNKAKDAKKKKKIKNSKLLIIKKQKFKVKIPSNLQNKKQTNKQTKKQTNKQKKQNKILMIPHFR